MTDTVCSSSGGAERTTLSSMHAMILTPPPQCSHTMTSIKKTRFNRWAHVIATWRGIASEPSPRGPGFF
jgi:hypothetical protein